MDTVLISGYDGYIGNALTQRLLARGYKVVGIDNFFRRNLVKELDSISAIPILDSEDKYKKFNEIGDFDYFHFDITNYNKLFYVIKKINPNIIVNLAHIPSAPFSMIDIDCATKTLYNNIIGTNNFLWAIPKINKDCHYITIGTTGEYDHCSNIDIEEGYFYFSYNGRKSNEMIYPRRANSVYHSSKISSTYLIDYMARIYNLRCTDIMQAVVVGMYTYEIDETKIFSRLDTDESFGTVVNRFVVQSLLNEPLTVFGEGKHQRGFLTLNDSIQALEIAIENPALSGKVQTWNQLSDWYSINEIVDMVKKVNSCCSINIESPRKEYTGDHYYCYKTNILKSLGYKPTRSIQTEIEYMINNIPEWNNEDKKILKRNVTPKIIFGE